jgi:hypothetical protein
MTEEATPTTGPRMAAILEQERPGREMREAERAAAAERDARRTAVLASLWRSGCDEVTMPSGVRMLLRPSRPRAILAHLSPDTAAMVTSTEPWNFEDPAQRAAYLEVRDALAQDCMQGVWDDDAGAWLDSVRPELARLPIEDVDVLYGYVDIDPADRRARAVYLDAVEAIAKVDELESEPPTAEPPESSRTESPRIDDEDGDPA